MKEHLFFDEEGNKLENKTIKVKYCWYKDTTLIAYLRNYRTGKTLYGASQLTKKTKNKGKYYHRTIAIDRLMNHPVIVTTSVNCAQSVVEGQIYNCVQEFGDYDLDSIGWDEEASYIYNNAEYINIKPKNKKRMKLELTFMRNQILKIMPLNLEYVIFKNNKSLIFCIYETHNNYYNNIHNYVTSKIEDIQLNYCSKQIDINYKTNKEDLLQSFKDLISNFEDPSFPKCKWVCCLNPDNSTDKSNVLKKNVQHIWNKHQFYSALSNELRKTCKDFEKSNNISVEIKGNIVDNFLIDSPSMEDDSINADIDENEYQSKYITENESDSDEEEFWKKLDVIYGPGNFKKIQETNESDGNNNTDVSSWDIIDKQCSPKKDKVTREKTPIPKSNIVTRSRKREED